MSQMSELLSPQRLRITDELGDGGTVECERWEVAQRLLPWYHCSDHGVTEAFASSLHKLERAMMRRDSERERELCALLGVRITRL